MKVLNLSLIILTLLLNCNNERFISKERKINENYLEIFYLKSEKLYPFTITCDMIRGEMFKKDRIELKVVEQKFVNKFLILYKKYKPSNKKANHDARIQVLIHRGKKVDVLCLGSHFGTSVNGKRMEDSPEILKLIKDKLQEKN